MANKTLTYNKILIVIGCGIVMAAAGCGLFATTINDFSRTGGLADTFFAVLFLVGAAMVIAGVIALLVKAISGN